MGKDAKGEAIDPELAEIYAEGVQVQTRLLEMLERVLEGKAAADQQRNYGSSNATMNVKVEGKGLTIAVCCAVFSATMFLASLIGFGMLYLNMKDHLDAIYMVAPELHQELNHERQAVQHHHPDAAPASAASVGQRNHG